MDAYNLDGASMNYGSGPALHLHSTRAEVQAFADELTAEYAEHLNTYGPPIQR